MERDEPDARGKVLLVDDEPAVLRGLSRQLEHAGYEVEAYDSGDSAVQRIRRDEFDVVVSDISMPGIDGLQLLRAVRVKDLDLPVVLVTGAPDMSSAIRAIDFGASKYLVKPVDQGELLRVVDRAVRTRRLARVKRDALAMLGTAIGAASDRAGLEAGFDAALDSLWMAYQPILRADDRRVFGYEALMRTDEPSLPHPGAVLDAAERLGEMERLGRAIRERAASPMHETDSEHVLFLNLHPRDLLDPTLVDPDGPLTRIAGRVVLEITERSALTGISDVPSRVAALREIGFRIAIDDLGAGYSGLASFTQLEPEIVKLDMSLVRDVDRVPLKQKLVRSMTQVCQDMGLLVVAEGIETGAERDALIDLGCNLLQGYLFARPERPFPVPSW